MVHVKKNFQKNTDTLFLTQMRRPLRKGLTECERDSLRQRCMQLTYFLSTASLEEEQTPLQQVRGESFHTDMHQGGGVTWPCR